MMNNSTILRYKPHSVYIVIFIVVYTFHFTILQAFLPELTSIYYIVILLSVVFTINRKTQIDTKIFPLILSSVLSIIISNDLLNGSVLRWITWILILLSMSPLISSTTINLIRIKLWYIIVKLFTILTVISFFWIMLSLPSIGVDERFTGGGKYFRNGVTAHEMVLAPMAGISGLYTFIRFLEMNTNKVYKFFFLTLSLVSIITMIMASSRSTIASFLIVLIIVLCINTKWLKKTIMRNLTTAIVTIILSPVIIIGLSSPLSSFLSSNSRLEDKGIKNSRDGLWNARLEDFYLNPLTGAGFHSVTKEAIKKHPFNGVNILTGRVEFGSSYFQAMSTMGLLGLLSIIYFLAHYFKRSLRIIKQKDGLLYFAVFLFFCLHSIVESYIFTSGAILCSLFWLTMSVINYQHTILKQPVRNKNVNELQL